MNYNIKMEEKIENNINMENDIDIEDENELTTYSYISNHLCFEYFVALIKNNFKY